MADLALGSSTGVRAEDPQPIGGEDRQPSVAVPSPVRSDRGARIFVWGCWTASTLTAFVAVLRGARNVPIQEDWHVIPAAAGLQHDFLAWLWLPVNEHRVPLPKLLYAGLLRMWMDFRVGMIVSMVLLVLVSAAFVVGMNRLRGRTRWTDAFFPLAFLHLGHWENLGWSWQLQFVLATTLAAGALLLIAASNPARSGRRALAAGACLAAIPLTGATALPFAPVMAVVLILKGRLANGLIRALLLGFGGLTLALTGLYFVGLHRPTWVPPSPGPAASAQTAVKVLSLSFGPAAGAWWLVAGLAALALFTGAGVVLLRARAWPLLAFLGAAVALAVLIGDGRAGLVRYYGLPDRYALVGVPGLCAVYLAFDRYGRAGVARRGPALLCVGMLALYPLNAQFGMQFRDWYHHRVDTFAGDVALGVPVEQLNYYRPIAAQPAEMRLGMWILHDRRVGNFAQLNETSEGPASVRRVDGLDSEASGWVTVGEGASGSLIASADQLSRLTWDYRVTTTWAAVGLTFLGMQDWRGMGAISLGIEGQGTGHAIRVRLGISQPGGAIDRYDSMFIDDQIGPRSIVIPWNGFGHVDVPGVYDLKGPLPLDRVVSLAFIAMEPGEGRITFERISLVPGHDQLGWPLHPSADRVSLPPWR